MKVIFHGRHDSRQGFERMEGSHQRGIEMENTRQVTGVVEHKGSQRKRSDKLGSSWINFNPGIPLFNNDPSMYREGLARTKFNKIQQPHLNTTPTKETEFGFL